MSSDTVLSPKLKKQFEWLRGLMEKATVLTDKSKDTKSSGVLRDRAAHLRSAALFVVVGEVKAGKSSFVNALLGETICEVAPDPCTARIQELVYGDERATTTIGDPGDDCDRITLLKEVLRDITIVDTPGTNSIIEKHQVVTEQYIPQSDLVIFVFPAKNPHTATAWRFLLLIRKDWHRKVVFVLQQADTATKHEISVNEDRVKQYARERNVQNPVVFAVSATREIAGAADSGFAEFRDFIRTSVETGEVWLMKFEGARDTLRTVLSHLLAVLRKEEAVIAAERAFYQELLSKVEARRQKANSLKALVVDSLCASYEQLATSLEGEFCEGLNVSTLLRRSLPFGIGGENMKDWLKGVQTRFDKKAKEQIEADAQRVSKDLSEEMKAMIDQLTEALLRRQEQSAGEVLSLGSDRHDLLENLRGKLNALRIADIVGEKGLGGSDLGSLTLAGGGLVALGAVIAALTHIMIFDITGGILATVGAAVIAVTLLWKRSSIMEELRQKLARSRVEFRSRLDGEISHMFDRLFLEIQHALREPLSHLEEQLTKVTPLAEEARCLSEEAQKS
jgi:predicted GTPase